MKELLPYPPIKEKDDHACVDLCNALADAVGHGMRFDAILERSLGDSSVPDNVKRLPE